MSETTFIKRHGLSIILAILMITVGYNIGKETDRLENRIFRSSEIIRKLEAELADLKKRPVTLGDRVIEEVRLKRLVLVDDQNRVRYVLEKNADSALQSFVGDNGNTRVALGVHESGSTIANFNTQDGEPLIIMGTWPPSQEKGASIYLNLPNGKRVIELDASANRSALDFFDPKTNVRSLTIDGSFDNSSGLATYNRKGELATMLAGGGGKETGLFISDTDRFRVSIGYNSKNKTSYINQSSLEGEIQFAVQTRRKDDFVSHIYQTPGERAWGVTQNVMTGVGILEMLRRWSE